MRAKLAGVEWDVCERNTHHYSSKSLISINFRSGYINVSGPAWESAGSPDMFVVLYSRLNRSIALRPATPTDRDGLVAASAGGTGTSRRVKCRSLCNRLVADGYQDNQLKRIPIQWHPDGLLWGDLTMGVKVKSRAAKGGAV